MLAFGWPLHKSLDFCPRTVTHSLAPIGQQIVSLKGFYKAAGDFTTEDITMNRDHMI